jgi:hypothetical protein
MRLVPEAAICKYDALMLSAKESLTDERPHSLDKTTIARGLIVGHESEGCFLDVAPRSIQNRSHRSSGLIGRL